MKKLLIVIPSLTQTNGVSSFLINYLSNIDLNKIDIDILSSNLRPSEYYTKFFKNNNIDYYFLPDLKQNGLIKYYTTLKSFFKKHNKYDAIYSHVANQSIFIFHEAAKYGIRNFALHSHATVSSSNKLKKMINDVLTFFIKRKLTYRVACSDLAGLSMFGKRKFDVVNNAIDYKKFNFCIDDRDSIRKSLNISGEFLIGFIGRFAPQKNIFFFAELAKILDNNYKIMMIGSGSQKNEFIEKIKNENTINKFILLDECSDVHKYYSAMDCFLLPSNFEGLPVVSIEAQANSLPCLLSNTISTECKIIETTKFLDRNNLVLWKNEIKNINKNRNKNIYLNDKFNITVQAKKFEEMLFKICNGDKND